jgi:hypothetical protein
MHENGGRQGEFSSLIDKDAASSGYQVNDRYDQAKSSFSHERYFGSGRFRGLVPIVPTRLPQVVPIGFLRWGNNVGHKGSVGP